MARKARPQEADSVYFLKLLMFFILGTIWMQFNGRTVLPLGLLAGLVFAQHDHFQIDRKVEYLTLLIAALLGLIGHGIYLAVNLS